MEGTQAFLCILTSSFYSICEDVGGNSDRTEGVLRVTDSKSITRSDLRYSSNTFDRIAQLILTFRASKTDVGKVSMSMAIRHRLVGPKHLVNNLQCSLSLIRALVQKGIRLIFLNSRLKEDRGCKPQF